LEYSGTRCRLLGRSSMILHLKAGIVESEYTIAARQRLGKHVPVATNTHITTE
jgi:hypothetical protein